jgi:hypothetical protein
LTVVTHDVGLLNAIKADANFGSDLGIDLSGIDTSKLSEAPKNLKAVGLALQAFKNDRLTLWAGLDYTSEEEAKARDELIRGLLPLLQVILDSEYGIKVGINQNQGGGGMMGGGPGMMGMMGGPNMMGGGPGMMGGPGAKGGGPGAGGMGMMGNMGGYGGMQPPGAGGSGPPGGMMGMMGNMGGYGGGVQPPGGAGGMMPPGGASGMMGMRGGAVGMQGGQGGDKPPDKPVSTMGAGLMDRTVVVVTMDLELPRPFYEQLTADIQAEMLHAKGEAEMGSGRSRIHELAAALKTYTEKRGTFPRGTADRPSTAERAGRPWPPDQRVSWLAEIVRFLPQYSARYANDVVYPIGIDVNRSWRDNENRRAAVSLIPQFLTPRSAPGQWWIVYPGQRLAVAATHFVGVAGVGLDAATLPGDNPRAGVFGYDRVTAVSQIKDGAANTIAVLQVPADTYKMPWLAGGGATVRGVPEKDSVLPFVCTEYKGKRGTFAIMANGDVRFVPETIKDAEFKALCTISGGEKVDVDKLTVLVPPDQNELKTGPLPQPGDQTPAKEGTPPGKEVTPPAPPPTKAPPPPPAKTGASQADAKTVTALQNNCAMCHTGPRAKKVQIFTQGGTLNEDPAVKGKMAEMVASGKMPPRNRPRPSGDDLAAIQGWLNATR